MAVGIKWEYVGAVGRRIVFFLSFYDLLFLDGKLPGKNLFPRREQFIPCKRAIPDPWTPGAYCSQ